MAVILIAIAALSLTIVSIWTQRKAKDATTVMEINRIHLAYTIVWVSHAVLIAACVILKVALEGTQ